MLSYEEYRCLDKYKYIHLSQVPNSTPETSLSGTLR